MRSPALDRQTRENVVLVLAHLRRLECESEFERLNETLEEALPTGEHAALLEEATVLSRLPREQMPLFTLPQVLHQQKLLEDALAQMLADREPQLVPFCALLNMVCDFVSWLLGIPRPEFATAGV